MQVPTIFTVLAFAIGASALPCCEAAALPHTDGPTVGPNGNAVCGNGQVISCCNTESVNNGAGGLLGVGGILNGVLGGNCSPLTIPIVGVAVPVSKACGDNQAACCTGNTSGLVNLQCNNVAVL